MIAVVLAALSGLSYGAADFFGALGSKRTNAILITLGVQGVSLVTLNAILVALPEETRRLTDLGWAALGGVAAAIALACFYRALAIGPMSTAAGLTAIVGTLVPVVVGLGLGERPSTLTLLGVAACVPAAALVSAGSPEQRAVVGSTTPHERVELLRRTNQTRALAFVAGLGFGMFFVSLSRVSGDAGLFPLVGARVASIVMLAGLLTARRAWQPMGRGVWRPVIAAGMLDCAANVTYLLAITRGDLTWVAAISSLYPVATVLLARLVLHERLSRWQVVGLLLAAGALAAVAAGR